MLVFKSNVLENVNVLIFDFLVEKMRYCGREDLFFFFFGLHQVLVEKQDFVDVKTFFFSLHRFLGF